MSARPKNSFALNGKMISAGGQTLALADITAVRRKTTYKPRTFGLIMLLVGLLMFYGGWRDDINRRQARQAKFARDYAQAEQGMGADGSSAALDDLHPLDITQALKTDAQLKKLGLGLARRGIRLRFCQTQTAPRHSNYGRPDLIYLSSKNTAGSQPNRGGNRRQNGLAWVAKSLLTPRPKNYVGQP